MAASRSKKKGTKFLLLRPPGKESKYEEEAECWKPTHVLITPDGYAFLMAGTADEEGFSPLVAEHGEAMGRVRLYLTPWIYTYMIDDHKLCAVISLEKLAEVGLILQVGQILQSREAAKGLPEKGEEPTAAPSPPKKKPTFKRPTTATVTKKTTRKSYFPHRSPPPKRFEIYHKNGELLDSTDDQQEALDSLRAIPGIVSVFDKGADEGQGHQYVKRPEDATHTHFTIVDVTY